MNNKGVQMKKIRFLAGAAFGAAVQYLVDPVSGAARRASLGEKVSLQVQELTGSVADQVRSKQGFLAGILSPVIDRLPQTDSSRVS
jgi:hypothetical protein